MFRFFQKKEKNKSTSLAMKSSKSGTNDIIYENLHPRKQIHASRRQIRHLFCVIAENQGSGNAFSNEMFPVGLQTD